MTADRGEKIFQVLLIEDNLGDIELMRHSLEGLKVPAFLHVARDGVEALQFLRRQESFLNAPRPDLVLLDLNLPRMSGHEVLTAIKGDPALLTIPVVVLTTSRAEHDIRASYQLHANACVTKSAELATFMERAQQTGRFWCDIATLPPG